MNNNLIEKQYPNKKCAKCIMSIMSFVYTLLGASLASLAIYTLVALRYGGENILSGYSLGTIYTSLIVGLSLFVGSIMLWCSVCRPMSVFPKIVLTIFSVVLLATMLLQIGGIVLSEVWMGNINVTQGEMTEINKLFNDTVGELDHMCCSQNVNNSLTDLCQHIIKEEGNFVQVCSNYQMFYDGVVTFIAPYLKWIVVVLGVLSEFNLVAFVSSCCLIFTHKSKSARYKPTTEGAYTQA